MTTPLPKKELYYQADAISANTNLGKTHFENFHTYRLEWTPGIDGNIKWYLDGSFLYSIGKNALNITGGQIPQEPMYLLLNTAMSKTWGFPQPCPDGCACDCYDCRDEKCACAIPQNMCNNFPAYFEIDWVRVYQKQNDSRYTVGCSTTEYPSSRYIKGHKKLFMGEQDKEPLKAISQGGDSCSSDDDCGQGTCNEQNICVCDSDFVGPNCLAANAFNDFNWEPDEPFIIDNLFVPMPLRIWAVVLTILVCSAAGYKYHSDNEQRRVYSPLGDGNLEMSQGSA